MDAACPTLTPVATARLLASVPVDGSFSSLDRHRARYWQPPPLRAAPRLQIVDEVERAGLLGRGGAGFPTARKLRSLAQQRGPRVVVANGAEGEPASHKDRLLLAGAPHLVVDGALLAAAAVGAPQVVIAVDQSHRAALAGLRAALAERPEVGTVVRIEVSPSRYVAGESSALVRWLNGGPAKPSGVPAHQSGVGGVPTLVQNVETLAHLAQIVNFGADWFRAVGPADEPGTVLLTVSGAVHQPSVVEVPVGTPVSDIVVRAGGVTARPQAVLVGGFFGTWIPAEAASRAPFSRAGLAPLGAAPGAGVVVVLPRQACGLTETARALRWFADQGAGQCGPCAFGLPAVAGGFEALARGRGGRENVARLRRWAGEIEGRGACHHPDGAVNLLRSALTVFGDDVMRHAAGMVCPGAGTEVLRVP